jgi:OFA family oxalate/formate antiporter-like MFS transporter
MDYYFFLLFYAFISGMGYGIIYMLPLKNAYSFFPNRKGLIGGIIMASYSFGAILWSQFSAKTINSTNEMPSFYLSIGNSIEILYPPTS